MRRRLSRLLVAPLALVAASLALTGTALADPATVLPAGTVGSFYSQSVDACPVSCRTVPTTVISGTLPPGLEVEGGTSTAIIGTPITAGTYDFTLLAVDDVMGPSWTDYSITIQPAAPPSLTTSSLAAGTVGASYSQTIAASGGSAPYTFSVSVGVLPDGLLLDSVTGVISGTPTKAGDFVPTVTVTDANSQTASQGYDLKVFSSLSPASLPDGEELVSYPDTVLVASGETLPYTFAVTSGSLPPGVTLASDGTLSDTPSGGSAGSYTFTVTAETSLFDPVPASRTYTVTIAAAPSLGPKTFATGEETVAFSDSVPASSGTAPYRFSVTDGALPPGLTLAADGTLSGTPTKAGSYDVMVMLTDANGVQVQRWYTIVIDAGPALSAATLADGEETVAYSGSLSASGGAAPYTFTVTGGTLPPGLTLAGDGALAGTPTKAGEYTFTAQVEDANGGTASHDFTIDISAGPSLPAATLAEGEQEAAYSDSLSASGGVTPCSFSVTGGALPPGLTLASDGTISGTASQAGDFTFTVTVSDLNGGTGSQTFTITIAAPLVLPAATLADGEETVGYTASLSATDGVAPYSFVLADGPLPPGLTLAGDGTISGTPTKAGSYSFIVTVSDKETLQASRTYTITIGAGPKFTTTSLPDGEDYQPYDQTLAATGGVAPYTFAVTSGVLPSGLRLNGSSGEISGRVAGFGSYSFTVTVTDKNGGFAERTLTLTVTEPVISGSISFPSSRSSFTESEMNALQKLLGSNQDDQQHLRRPNHPTSPLIRYKNGATLDWKSVEYAAGYRIYEGTGKDKKLLGDPAARPFPLTSLVDPGESVILAITAYNEAGESDPLYVKVTHRVRPKAAPTTIPGWAWAWLKWHGTPLDKRGDRPAAAPKDIPDWCWAWAKWHSNPFYATQVDISTSVSIFDN
jgi:hypothetical protein